MSERAKGRPPAVVRSRVREPHQRPDRRHDEHRAEERHQDARLILSHDVTHDPDEEGQHGRRILGWTTARR